MEEAEALCWAVANLVAVKRLLLTDIPQLQGPCKEDRCRCLLSTCQLGSCTAQGLVCAAVPPCLPLLLLMTAKLPGAFGTKAAVRRAAACFARFDTCRNRIHWDSG